MSPAVPRVARVLPDVAGFDRELDYEVPAALAPQVRVGTVVRVPLQGRRVRGWVTAYPVKPTEGVALRPLAKVSGWGPEPEVLDLVPWAAWRWWGRRRSFLVTASPLIAARNLPPPSDQLAARDQPSPLSQGAGEAAGQTRLQATNGTATSQGPAAQVVRAAWAPGTHVVRLPPVYSASELVSEAASRGPVLVVAPTTARAEAGCAALRRQGISVALLPGDWPQARGGVDVVIGARAAAWGPCPGLASIVVLDAHEEGLVQEQAPTWDAAAVAAERGRRAGVPCLLVSACPTLELLGAADKVHTVSRAAERDGWAALQVVDSREEDPRAGLYSAAVVDLVRGGGRVVCVFNRKGRAQLAACGACAELATCERCGASVALLGTQLVCRRCALERPVVCRHCGSDTLRVLRPGLTRVREHLEALAGRPVSEVTAATTEVSDALIVVGTEAVLYREGELRRTGGVDAVAFLDFDQELLAARYRAGEEALALLARASRLVGGRHRGGRVLVQTRAPGHSVIEAAVRADPSLLSDAEGPVRRALRLPPYAALALVSGPGAGQLAAQMGATVSPGASLAEVNDVGDGRWLVRAADGAALADVLSTVTRPQERVRVEVGPVRF